MKVTIAKWGNSYAARIPKHIIEEKGLTEGSLAEMDLKVVKKQRPTLKELLAKVGPEGDPYGEIEWGKPVGKEVW